MKRFHRWLTLEIFRGLVLIALVVETMRLAFDLIGGRWAVFPFRLLFLGILFAYYVLVSATNIYPALRPNGFVPASVPMFTRWRFHDPFVPFHTIYGIRIRKHAGVPYWMDVVTKYDRRYGLSMKGSEPEEQAVALGILDWTKQTPPDRAVEGETDIVMGWGRAAKESAAAHSPVNP